MQERGINICRKVLFGSALAMLFMLGNISSATAQGEKKNNDSPLESLFYSKNEIRNIKEAYITFLNKESGVEGGSDVTASEYYDKAAEIKRLRSESRYFTYPQFFLESLVFHSDIDWSIWLSGNKITAEYPVIPGELRVVDISKSRVIVEWTPYDMEKVKEIWEKNQNDGVVVDLDAGTVQFTLLPNQTFSSYMMRVVEGKLIPVTIDRKEIEEELQFPVDIKLPGQDASSQVADGDIEENPIPDKPMTERSLSKEFIGLFGN